MKTSQADVRKQLAEKTREIVDRQTALTLPEFLAQGQKRSRQRRDAPGHQAVKAK